MKKTAGGRGRRKYPAWAKPKPKKNGPSIRGIERNLKAKALSGSVPSKWMIAKSDELRAKKNKGEEQIESLLKAAGILFTREFACRYKREYSIDFVVEVGDKLVAIEVDGSQHMTNAGQKADRIREKNILDGGEICAFARMTWARSAKESKDSLRELLELMVGVDRGVFLLY